MKKLGRDLIDEAVSLDLVTFIHRAVQTVAAGQPYLHNWHIDALAYQLMKVEAGQTKRLVVAMPPRHLKSTCASVAFPAWLLGRDPTLKIVCISYTEDLTSKLALDTRTIMQSPWYRRAFPKTRLSRERNRELDFMTTAGGGRYATTVGGPLTGRGGDIIIVDDPLKPVDAMSDARRSAVNEWCDRTLYSRLDDKQSGAILMISQRLHLDDLVGHVLSKGGQWECLTFPAIAETDEDIQIGPGQWYHRRQGEVLHEDRESAETLEELRRDLGSLNFSAQYQQCPVPLDGELLKWRWFSLYDDPPAPEDRDMVVQSWDTASTANATSDYSVCTTWRIRKGQYFLLDVLRQRLIYPDLRRRIIAHADDQGASTVLIENAGSGMALVQELRHEGMSGRVSVIGVKPEGDKVTRLAAQSAVIEGGRVHIPKNAPWLDQLRIELLQFPQGRHDDQADSISQLLGWAEKKRRLEEQCSVGICGPIVFCGDGRVLNSTGVSWITTGR